MATRQGRRFGEDRPVQRNVDNYGDYVNRSPGQSNANRLAPSVREDLGTSTTRDVERVNRGLNKTATTAMGRAAQQAAANRAAVRLLGRAGYLGASFQGGKDLGDAAVDAYIKKLSEGKVKLTKEAKQRIKDEEDFQEMKKAMNETQPEKKKSQTQSERFRARSEEFTSNRKDGYAKGGMTKKRK
jgi:hypothetical protein